MTAIETIDRRLQAIVGAKKVASSMATEGVRLKIIGSLVKGDFGPYSDVDFLVTECPRHLKYAIESKVEDLLGGLPFDLIYLDEIPVWKVESFVKDAVDAGSLR